MNKRASTESNTSFAIIELIIAIPIAIMLVSLIFFGFKLLLGDDASTQLYTTTITQTDTLIDELLSRPKQDSIVGTYPVQIHTDSYVMVSDSKENAICVYSYSGNKQLDCHTFTKARTISIENGIMPLRSADEVETSSVQMLSITLSQTSDDKFIIKYALNT